MATVMTQPPPPPSSEPSLLPKKFARWCPHCCKKITVASSQEFQEHIRPCLGAKHIAEAKQREAAKKEVELEENMSEEEKKKLASWKVDFKGRDGEKFVIADVKESVQNPRFYAHTEGGLGSDGVMFIQRKEGGVVVLKAVGGVGELFGTLLFKKVQENIQQKHQREHPLWFTPDMRPLRRDSEEFNQFSSNLKILRKINPNHHCASIVHRFLQKKMMLVMTPLPSYSALQCPALSFWDYYTEDVLFSLGAMMAMDMLLNNWDRLPLLWSNSGNPANTLLLHPSSYFLPSPSSSPSSSPLMSLSSPRLGVIDQTPTVIGGEKERQRYFDKVSRVISCTSPPPFTPPPPNPNPSSSYRRLCSPPPPSPFSGSPPSSTLPSPPSSSSSSSSSSSNQKDHREPHISTNEFYDQFSKITSSAEETSFVELLDQKILVVLRDGKNIVGVCRSFDQFANLVLEDAHERIFVPGRYAERPLGLYLIRGDNLSLIGELEGEVDSEKLKKCEPEEIMEEYNTIREEKEKEKKLLRESFHSRFANDDF